ncbi:hypothetical protein P691DRAFT_800993 [Macrolepiota fuliginosa MF-IS2]|uniref:Uncharacterized protein n=1 Tax=Macrolepiota fuliginosa MF-IS2 TaxID=1400762 RepID=A0A9P5XCQ4_9AGAR|nr:hypothetical protein P691DRAFT_800993 [Macrolepiota fuliginosa MF-IS2]
MRMIDMGMIIGESGGRGGFGGRGGGGRGGFGGGRGGRGGGRGGPPRGRGTSRPSEKKSLLKPLLTFRRWCGSWGRRSRCP